MSTPPSPAPNQPTETPAAGAPGMPEGGQPNPADQVQTPPASAPSPQQAPATPPAPSEPATEQPKGKTPKFDGEFDPKRFEKLVENLRGDVAAEKAKREAAEQKARDEQNAFMKRVAAAFGLDTGEEKPPTPEELAKQLEAERSEKAKLADAVRQRDVEFAVYQSAAQFGGDPGALLDSRSFTNAIAKLDPASDGFAAEMEKAVKTAIERNPKLAAKAPEPTPTPAPPKGGADLAGAPGGKRQLTGADVARMTPEQIVKAREAGQLNAYLGRGG